MRTGSRCVETGADAEHDGAAVAGRDDAPRFAVVDHRDAVGTVHLEQGRTDPFDERPLLRTDELGEDLGVGVGGERCPVGDQAPAQLVGVLDDAVVHDRDVPRAVEVRVGVGVVGFAVGGPAGVGDAGGALEALR